MRKIENAFWQVSYMYCSSSMFFGDKVFSSFGIFDQINSKGITVLSLLLPWKRRGLPQFPATIKLILHFSDFMQLC